MNFCTIKKQILKTCPRRFSALKVYGFPLSQPTRSVLQLCYENNIECELINVNVFKGEHRKKNFLLINPQGLVPVISDEDFNLGESASILLYISESRELTKWYPSSDIKSRAQVNYWLHWNHSNTRESTNKILAPNILRHFYPNRTEKDDAIALKKYKTSIQFLENYFISSGKPFLAHSTTATIADLLILPEMDQLMPEAFNLFDYSPYKHVSLYIERLRSQLKHYDRVFNPVKDVAKKFKDTGKLTYLE
eukprot:gene11930-24995_t